MQSLLPAAGLAMALTLLATLLLRWTLLRAGLLDHPNRGHKAHPRPLPAFGGVAVTLGVVVAALYSGFVPDWPVAVFAACGVVFGIGALDDLLHLSPWQKLTAELLCAATVCAAGMTLPLGPLWAAAPATALWLALCANGFNLSDGVDGLAALTGVSAAVGLSAMAALHGQAELAAALAIVAAALGGFLVFNFPRASIFLGDSGSLPLGFTLGVCGVAWARLAPDPVAASAPLFALALPLGETLLSAARRALRGDPIFRADRRHIHHRLAARGLSPVEVTLWCGGYSALGAAAGVAVAWNGASTASAFAAAAFALVTAAALRYLRYPELACVAEMLLHVRAPWSLAHQIRVTELRQGLEAAAGPEERWGLIVEGMRELGFREVRLLDRAGRPLRQSSPQRAGLEGVWKLTVDLPDGEGLIEAERLPGDGGEALVSDALVKTLRRAFAHAAPAAQAVPHARATAESSPS